MSLNKDKIINTFCNAKGTREADRADRASVWRFGLGLGVGEKCVLYYQYWS